MDGLSTDAHVEPANGQESFGAPELPLDKTIFPAGIGLQSLALALLHFSGLEPCSAEFVRPVYH